MARDFTQSAKEYYEWLKHHPWQELVTFTAKPYLEGVMPGDQWWNMRCTALQDHLRHVNVRIFGVSEKSAEGRIHLHAVASGDVVALETWWRENGYGIVDRKVMHTPLNGLAYVLKNVHKRDARIIGKLAGGMQGKIDDILGTVRSNGAASCADGTSSSADSVGRHYRSGVSSRFLAERSTV